MLAEVDQKTKALQAEFERPKLEPERIYERAEELADARKKLLKSRCHSIIKIHEILTQDQLRELVSMVNK